MIKTTGLEFKRFYADPAWWPEDNGRTWYEEEYIEVDGKEFDGDDYIDIKDGSVVRISAGIVRKEEKYIDTFEGYFRRWRQSQKEAVFLVTVTKEKSEAVIAAIRAAGGRVAQ